MQGDKDLLKELLREASSLVYYDQTAFLRENTYEPEHILNIIDQVEGIVIESDEERYRVYSALGYMYRVVGYPEHSIKLLRWCLDYLQELYDENDIRIMACYLKYAESLKCAGHIRPAMEILKLVEDICIKYHYDSLLDFVYQHQAKCYIELDELYLAKDAFQNAYDLRLVKANPSLIKSTQVGIRYVESLIEHQNKKQSK